MKFKIIKRILIQSLFIRRTLYKRRYNIDNKTAVNNCFLNAVKGNSITCRNSILGDSVESGEQPLRITIKHNGMLILNKNSRLRGGCKILINGNGVINISDNSYINWNSFIACGGNAKILIGKNCALAWNINLIAYDFHIYNEKTYYGDIIISNNVWIGANVTILKNTTIGEGCIIAANSNVTGGNYPAKSLIGGNPAKILKDDVNWRNLTKEEKQGLING